MAKCLFAVILFALLVAIPAACGGGDDEKAPDTTAAPSTTADETPALTREEIIAEGDAICAEVNAAVGGLESTETTPAGRLSLRTDLYTGMVERLRGLSTEDPELTDVFSAGRDLIQASAEAEAAAEAGDTEATVAAETTVQAALEAFRRAASEYGFTECGGEPSISVDVSPGGGTDEPSESPADTGGTETPEPSEPSDGGAAGGAPPGGTAPGVSDGGGTDGGADPGGGDAGTGGAGGGGGGSNTGGFSPGG